MLNFANRTDSAALADQRGAAREEIFYRTRCTAPRIGTQGLQIVNISATGFMARTEAELEASDMISVRLPVIGMASAEVRWALGGRIGCQFERMIPLAPYLELLGELVKGAR